MKATELFTQDDIKRLKDLCITYEAQYIIVDDIKLVVPLDKWKYERELNNQ